MSADVLVYDTHALEGEHRHGCRAKWVGHTISRTDTEFSPPIATRSGASALSHARTTWISAPWSCRRSIKSAGGPSPLCLVLNASRLTAESKACTQSSPLPRSRSRFLCRILHSRTPSRSYCTRFLTPPLKRPPARLARPLA
jgi:hypothetical protein